MNILFIATVYNHLSAFHKPFIKYFQNKGYVVHVAGSNSMGRKGELEQLGAICHDINFDKSILTKNNKEALQELNDLFDKINFDLIHVHTPIAAFLVRYVLKNKKSQGPLLYTAHGFHFFEGAPRKNWMLFYTAEKLAKKWTDGIIVMNEEDLRLAQKMGFKQNENLFMVNGVGVDLQEFNERTEIGLSIREELTLTEKDIIISCVAELSYRKNQLFLLQNWKEVYRSNPHVHLLLIGEGEEEQNFQNFIQLHGLKNIHLLGFRRDMPKILSDTDIVVLTSLHEGLPRCLMEAVVLGKPMIATNVRGSRDIVADSKNGFLVELNDGKSLATRLIELSNDSAMRLKFGTKAKEDINKYSLDTVLTQMDAVYRKYLK